MRSFLNLVKDRRTLWVDSKEGCRSPWRHQPHPSQFLNPQTVVEHEGQEAESVFDFSECWVWWFKNTAKEGRKVSKSEKEKASYHLVCSRVLIAASVLKLCSDGHQFTQAYLYKQGPIRRQVTLQHHRQQKDTTSHRHIYTNRVQSEGSLHYSAIVSKRYFKPTFFGLLIAQRTRN